MQNSMLANLYNPHNQNKEELIAHFVVRVSLFKDLFTQMTNWENPSQHFLIEGKRGMGKTSLLLRLSYEIENDPQLKWLLPVVFKEEVYYRVNSLDKLWEETAQILTGKYPKFKGLHQQMQNAYNEHIDYERYCFELLDQTLQIHQQKIILFIDNLGELLQNFQLQDCLRLHEILINNPNIRVVGGSSVIFETLFDYKHPFYEFFQITPLRGLDKTEAEKLLYALASSRLNTKKVQEVFQKDKARIETLLSLSGGVIRTIILMFDVLFNDENGQILSDLEKILDQVTPLYQHRLNDLNASQRAVIDKVALSWDAISLDELATQLRQPPADLQATLQGLVQYQVLQELRSPDEILLYQLQERFFNIWYLMRLASSGMKQKVLWLIHFFESWYKTPALIEEQIQHHLQLIKNNQISPKTAQLYYEAFSKMSSMDMESQQKLKEETYEFLKDTHPNLAQGLSMSDKELIDKILSVYTVGVSDEISLRESLSYANLIQYPSGYSENLIGLICNDLKQHLDAEKKFKSAWEKGYAKALINLGYLYQEVYEDYQRAETYYQKAIEQGDEYALFAMGVLYNDIYNNYERAKYYFEQASDKGNTEASYALGLLYNDVYQDFRQAEKYFQLAAENGKHQAYYALGLLHHNLHQNNQQAENYFLKSLELGNTKANYALGWMYDNIYQDYGIAEKYYKAALQSGNPKAMHNLGWIYDYIYQDFTAAEEYYQMASHEGDIQAMANLADLLLRNKKYIRADGVFQQLISKIDDKDPEEKYPLINNYLASLLVMQQYAGLEKYFNDPNLKFKHQFKPLYYAYLRTIGHADYIKMPPEIGQTVDSIVDQVGQMTRSLTV